MQGLRWRKTTCGDLQAAMIMIKSWLRGTSREAQRVGMRVLIFLKLSLKGKGLREFGVIKVSVTILVLRFDLI
jgi:hypothetical protein